MANWRKANAEWLISEDVFQRSFKPSQFENPDQGSSSVSFFQNSTDTPAVFPDIADR